METQAIYTGKFNGKVYGAGDIVKITYCTVDGGITCENEVAGRIIEINRGLVTIDCSEPFYSHVVQIRVSCICNIEDYKSTLQCVANPLVKYLQTHYHPHCTAIVDQIHAEILEGVEVTRYTSPD